MNGTGTALDPYIILTRTDLEWIWGDDGDASACYKLGADIDLAGSDFAPIGIYGTFDGNHHRISNMTIHQSGSSISDVGLFGEIQGSYGSGTAYVKDLSICNAHIHVTVTDTAQNIGILAGNIGHAEITGVTVSGTIVLDGAGTVDRVGGICGWLQGDSIIEDCHIVLTVDKPEARATGDYATHLLTTDVGGVCGQTVSSANPLEITDCVVGLTISNSDTTLWNGKNYLFGTHNVGGICGTVNEETSVALCRVSVTILPAAGFNCSLMGGLLAVANYAATVEDCTASGIIHGFTTGGGLAAYGTHMTFTRCGTSVDISAGTTAGGAIGDGGEADGGLVCTDCWATGDVSGSEAGGFIAVGEGTYTRCYATGAVTATYCGGFAGSLAPVADACTNCFWDTQTSGQASSMGGTGKTTAEMQTQGTFTGWNFTTVWNIASGAYPFLRTAFTTVTDGCASVVHSFPWVGKFQLSHVTA